jgi:NAD(P)-dependent dehydrogenase (short-subunit alcohol dehydrogenase family)
MTDTPELNGKIAVVTGATSGIGLASVIALTKMGATVLAVGRSDSRCTEAEKKIKQDVPDVDIRFLMADLSAMEQVRRLARDIRRELSNRSIDRLDILVNNAGVYVDRYTRTLDGFELTMAVNHFAPFLLTHELLPLLLAGPAGRVITTSSDSHYNTWLDIPHIHRPILYNGLWAYKCSKLANVLFTKQFNRIYRSQGVRAFAIDPGLVSTDIGFKQTGKLARWVWQKRKDAGVPAEIPARTIAFLAGMPLDHYPDQDYWYDCRPKPASKQANRQDLALDLWEESVKSCIRENPIKRIHD